VATRENAGCEVVMRDGKDLPLALSREGFKYLFGVLPSAATTSSSLSSPVKADIPFYCPRGPSQHRSFWSASFSCFIALPQSEHSRKEMGDSLKTAESNLTETLWFALMDTPLVTLVYNTCMDM